MKNVLRYIDKKIVMPYLPDKEWEQYYIFRDIAKKIYVAEGLDNSPAEIKKCFAERTDKWVFEKFYFKYTKPCVIEPLSGWAITEDGEAIPQAIWNNFINGVNSSYLRFKFSKRKKIFVDSAIVLSYAWNNYWHFYNDILGQLRIADEFGISTDTPIVINTGVQRMDYFNDIVGSSLSLRNRNWLFHESDVEIHCKTAHFFNTYWDKRANFDAVLDYVEFENADQYFLNRRIFIARNPKRGRNVTNLDSVVSLLNKYSFEIIDCDGMSVGQQAELFRNASHVIGIHGAGLTNIVYRKNRPMKLLEIFSKDFFNPPYFWLCQQYNFDYHSMVAGGSNNPDDANGNFMIDTGVLEQKIKALLAV